MHAYFLFVCVAGGSACEHMAISLETCSHATWTGTLCQYPYLHEHKLTGFFVAVFHRRRVRWRHVFSCEDFLSVLP